MESYNVLLLLLFILIVRADALAARTQLDSPLCIRPARILILIREKIMKCVKDGAHYLLQNTMFYVACVYLVNNKDYTLFFIRNLGIFSTGSFLNSLLLSLGYTLKTIYETKKIKINKKVENDAKHFFEKTYTNLVD